MFNDVGAQIRISRKFCVVCSAGQKDYMHVHKLIVTKVLVNMSKRLWTKTRQVGA